MKPCSYCGGVCEHEIILTLASNRCDFPCGHDKHERITANYCTLTCLFCDVINDIKRNEEIYKIGLVDETWVPVMEQLKLHVLHNAMRIANGEKEND